MPYTSIQMILKAAKSVQLSRKVSFQSYVRVLLAGPPCFRAGLPRILCWYLEFVMFMLNFLIKVEWNGMGYIRIILIYECKLL